MPEPDDSRERMARSTLAAARYAEGSVYSMNNPYLTRYQKAIVEAWYQFPIGVFGYLIMICLAFYQYSYVQALSFAYLVAGVVSIIGFCVYLPDRLLIVLGALFAGPIEMGISLVFMVLFLYRGDWGAAGIAIASGVGLLSILSPSMHLYTIFSPHGMHCKYAFAKSHFGIDLSFEPRDCMHCGRAVWASARSCIHCGGSIVESKTDERTSLLTSARADQTYNASPPPLPAMCPDCRHTWQGNWDSSFKDRQCPQCGKRWVVG